MTIINITSEQKQKLIDKLGIETTNHYIENLENYLLSIGQPKKYKSQYHAILTWYAKDTRNKVVPVPLIEPDKKLIIAHKIYKNWIENVTKDPLTLEKGFIEIKPKALQNVKSKMHYKKNFNEFIRILRDEIKVPNYLLDQIAIETR